MNLGTKLRNGLILIVVGLIVGWAIASFTYRSVPLNNTHFARPPEAGATESPLPTPIAVDATEEEDQRDDAERASHDEATRLGLVTEGIVVQVLHASDREDAGNRLAKRLRQLGFEVGFVDMARTVERTTVYWTSDDSRKAAEKLARAFDWAVAPKPDSISAPADIHVLVGDDFPGG